MYCIKVESGFSAAHQLSGAGGKCENLHGHNYRVHVEITGSDLDASGMLLDFGKVKSALATVLKNLDHSFLNNIPYFKNSPSAERIARYIHEELSRILESSNISAVDVFESDSSMARYSPDN